jgi:hypothetical protein
VVLLASAADAATSLLSYQLSYWMQIVLTLPGAPGEFGAWFLNGALGLGHSVTSAQLEFVLSLPFNFGAYWLLFRICASVIMVLLPTKRGRKAESSVDPRANEEFDRQT